MAKKVTKKLKEEVERKGLKLSVTEDGRKSKMIALCQRGYPGRRPENDGQEVGSERKSKKEEVQSEIFDR